MGNRRTSFFLTPSWDQPGPPDCPIKLGNVIKHILEPHKPFCTVPKDAKPATQQDFSLDSRKLKSNRIGIWTRFFSKVAGISVNAGIDWGASDDFIFKCELLTTVQFNTNPEYLKECIDTAEVKAFLEESGYRNPIYIITGLKIARNATMGSTQAADIEAKATAEVDSSALGVAPTSVGPGFNHTKNESRSISWRRQEEFVFAFQACEVKVDKVKKIVKSDKTYAKGTVLDAVTTEASEIAGYDIKIIEAEVDVEDEGCVEEEFGDVTDVTWALPN